MLTIFNKSNAQIIILEFRSRLEDMNIINFEIFEVIFSLVCILEL
jgi:hypothetical protein